MREPLEPLGLLVVRGGDEGHLCNLRLIRLAPHHDLELGADLVVRFVDVAHSDILLQVGAHRA